MRLLPAQDRIETRLRRPASPVLAAEVTRSARRLAAALTGCAFLLLASALSAHAAPLEIAVARTPLSLPLYVAQAQRYFDDEGVAVKLSDCRGGHQCLQQLLAGFADIATAADSPVMFRSFERRDYAVIATFATTSDDVKLVASRSAGVARPADLRGKKVGVVRGSSSHYVLDSFLLLNGIDPRAVELVSLQADELPAALRSRKVAAVSAWEPFAFDSIRAARGDTVVLPNVGAYTLSFNLVAHRRVAGARDAELVKLLRALERAQELIRAQPQVAQAILRQRLDVAQDFVEWVWPGLSYQLSLDHGLIKTLESEARWAIREGHVSAKVIPNYLDFTHAAPLREAMPHAVGLAH